MADSPAVADTKHGEAHADPAHGHHHGDYLSHVKPYLVVGGLLFIATCVTVWFSYVDFAEWRVLRKIFGWIGVTGHGINILVGLLLATAKVCLVGAWFMHLKDEKSTI